MLIFVEPKSVRHRNGKYSNKVGVFYFGNLNTYVEFHEIY